MKSCFVPIHAETVSTSFARTIVLMSLMRASLSLEWKNATVQDQSALRNAINNVHLTSRQLTTAFLSITPAMELSVTHLSRLASTGGPSV